MPGPLPRPKSIAPEARPCCSLASPVKLMISTSRSYVAKTPSFTPTSSGTKVKAVGTALPTRTWSALEAARGSTPAQTKASAIAPRARMAVRCLGIRFLPVRSAAPLPGARLFTVGRRHSIVAPRLKFVSIVQQKCDRGQAERNALPRLAPDLGGGLDDETQLCLFLVDRQLVAGSAAGKAALRRERELLKRHKLRRLGDTALQILFL